MSIIAPQCIQNINLDEVFELIEGCYNGRKYISGINEQIFDFKVVSFKGVGFVPVIKPPIIRQLGIMFHGLKYSEKPCSLHFKAYLMDGHSSIVCEFHLGTSDKFIICEINFNKLNLKCVKSIKNQLIKYINKINEFLVSVSKQIDVEEKMRRNCIKPLMSLIDQFRYTHGAQHVGRVIGTKEVNISRRGQLFNKLVSELKYVENEKGRYKLINAKEYNNYIDSHYTPDEDELAKHFDLCKFRDEKNDTELFIYIKNGTVRVSPSRINGKTMSITDERLDKLTNHYFYLKRNVHLRDNVAGILELIDKVYTKMCAPS